MADRDTDILLIGGGIASAYVDDADLYERNDLAAWLTLEYVGLGGPWDRADVEAVEHPLRFSVRYTHWGGLTGVCSVGGGDLEWARVHLRRCALGREGDRE
jgi:hypothetical protein